MSIEQAVLEVVKEYYRAFSMLDVEAIVPFFHQPALLLGAARVVQIEDADALKAVFGRTMDELRSKGYGRSEFEWKQSAWMNPATAQVSGTAVRYKTDGGELERVDITYTLQKAGSDWRIVVIVFHDR